MLVLGQVLLSNDYDMYIVIVRDTSNILCQCMCIAYDNSISSYYDTPAVVTLLFEKS